MSGILELCVVLAYLIIVERVFNYSISLLQTKKILFKDYRLNFLVGILGLVLGIVLFYWFIEISNNQIEIMIDSYRNDCIKLN